MPSTISELAANSFGLKFCRDSFPLQLKLILEQIKFIEAQVSDVEAETKKLLEAINSPITTIPGIGSVIGAVILGEIGDIKRFSTPAKFVASNSDPVFKAFYQKKRSEGKHHLTALGAVARKLCYTIHAIPKSNKVYQVQKL